MSQIVNNNEQQWTTVNNSEQHFISGSVKCSNFEVKKNWNTYNYVIISWIFIQKQNISVELS